jgi:hypothetical protein
MPTSLPAAFPRNAVAAQTTPPWVQALSRVSRAASGVDTTWMVLIAFCLAGIALSSLAGSNGIDLDFIPGLVGP